MLNTCKYIAEKRYIAVRLKFKEIIYIYTYTHIHTYIYMCVQNKYIYICICWSVCFTKAYIFTKKEGKLNIRL